MSSIKDPLTLVELQSLDQYLRQKIGKKRRLSLTWMHGLLCAILTAPTLPYPNSNFLLMAETETDQNQPIPEHNLWLDKLTYQISQDLEQEATYPFLFENNLISPSKVSWKLLKEWCGGYLQGAGLDRVWVKDEHGLALTMPMGILADELDLVGLFDSSNHRIVDNLPHKKLALENLPNTIASLYAYWKKQYISEKESGKKIH